jgi:hypothetical protein
MPIREFRQQANNMGAKSALTTHLKVRCARVPSVCLLAEMKRATKTRQWSHLRLGIVAMIIEGANEEPEASSPEAEKNEKQNKKEKQEKGEQAKAVRREPMSAQQVPSQRAG